MSRTGKRFQFTCAIPNIDVLQRLAIETRLKAALPAHSIVEPGDTDWDNNRRLHIFTDSPPEVVNILGKVLDERGIAIEQCRCHCRNLLVQDIPVPGEVSMDTEEVRGMVAFFDRAGNILGEVIRKNPDNPRRWRKEVKRRYSLLACPRHSLIKVEFAGINVPPADQLGLINMWQIARANRQLFPSLFDPSQRSPEWRKKRARSR